MRTQEDQITRVVSETDLQRIDKTATFATHAMVQPAELLARLVNILGYIPPATEDPIGVGDSSNQTTFVEQNNTGVGRCNKIEDNSEKELLAKKESTTYTPSSGLRHGGIWTIGHDKIPRFLKPRSRAVSEVRLDETRYLSHRSNERTWSGPTAARKMQELMKTEMPNESSNNDRNHDRKDAKFSKFRSFALAKSVPKALISSGPCKNWFSTGTEKKSLESEREINNKDIATRSFVSGLTRYEDNKRRDSRSSVVSNSTRHYYTHTGAGNSIESSEGSNLLEETSVADFLRALTLLHASVATTGSWTASADDDHLRRNQPRRKMGTASLTPPKLPSLFTLFSPPQPTTTTTLQESSVNDNNARGRESRRNSLTFVKPTVTKSRRFSLRPVATPISPPTPPRNTGSPFLSVNS